MLFISIDKKTGSSHHRQKTDQFEHGELGRHGPDQKALHATIYNSSTFPRIFSTRMVFYCDTSWAVCPILIRYLHLMTLMTILHDSSREMPTHLFYYSLVVESYNVSILLISAKSR